MMFKFVVVLAFVSAHASQLPASFQLCRRNDPKLNACLQSAVEGAVRYLATGSPELGIAPLEPLEVPSITIGAGSGPVNVVQDYKNAQIYGIASSSIARYEAKLDEYYFYVDSVTPTLRLEADYNLDGNILLFRIKGEGRANITLVNLRVMHTLRGVPFEKKGRKYMELSEYKVIFEPERVEFRFDNLFNGNEKMSRELHTVINDNFREVFQDVKASYEEVFGEIFKNIANRVFTRVPFDNIFLSD